MASALDKRKFATGYRLGFVLVFGSLCLNSGESELDWVGFGCVVYRVVLTSGRTFLDTFQHMFAEVPREQITSFLHRTVRVFLGFWCWQTASTFQHMFAGVPCEQITSFWHSTVRVFLGFLVLANSKFATTRASVNTYVRLYLAHDVSWAMGSATCKLDNIKVRCCDFIRTKQLHGPCRVPWCRIVLHTQGTDLIHVGVY